MSKKLKDVMNYIEVAKLKARIKKLDDTINEILLYCNPDIDYKKIESIITKVLKDKE